MFWEPHLKLWEVALETLGLIAVPLFCFYVVLSPLALLHYAMQWPARQNRARKRAMAAKRAAAERKRRKETWPTHWRPEWGEPPQVVMANPNAVPGNYVYPAPQPDLGGRQPWPSYSYPNAPSGHAPTSV